MKILFISNIPSPYRVDFFNELGKYSDLTVTYERKTASDRDKKWSHRGPKNYRQIVFNGISLGVDKAFSLGILKVLKEKWDAIIVGGYSTPTGILTIRYLKRKRIPFYIEADGGFVREESIWKRKIKTGLISSASGWFVSGKATTDYFVHYGAEESKCYQYPFTSLSEKEISENISGCRDKDNYREKLGIKEEKVILYVGRMIPIKGVDVLLNAAKKLEKRIGIYLVGGEPTEEYQSIIKDTGCKPDRIHFPGFKTGVDLEDYYRAADAFVFPTRGDAWGLVVNEAMSYGLPVITTDRCIAGLELIKDGVNGRLVKHDDNNELADAITDVLSDENCSVYGLKASEMIKDYTIENMVRAHVDVLRTNGGKL